MPFNHMAHHKYIADFRPTTGTYLYTLGRARPDESSNDRELRKKDTRIVAKITDARNDGDNTYVFPAANQRIDPQMVRKKKLSPSGAKDENGEYHNVHVNLHEDELAVAGMEIGDEVFVRVRDGKIIIQKADPDQVEHDF